MLARIIGIDPGAIKSNVEDLAASAVGMHSEQQRLAEFQNLLAQNAIKANDRLDKITHDLANMAMGIEGIFRILDCASAGLAQHAVLTSVEIVETSNGHDDG